MLVGAAPSASVTVALDGLRSHKGQVIACLTANARAFPNCTADAAARHMTVPASRGSFSFSDVPSGTYAVSLIHDENGNGKLDTFAGLPREGVGFSRNPRITFGAPGFAATSFAVKGATEQRVTLKYFL